MAKCPRATRRSIKTTPRCCASHALETTWTRIPRRVGVGVGVAAAAVVAAAVVFKDHRGILAEIEREYIEGLQGAASRCVHLCPLEAQVTSKVKIGLKTRDNEGIKGWLQGRHQDERAIKILLVPSISPFGKNWCSD